MVKERKSNTIVQEIINIGSHGISERELYKRIVDKIPRDQFAHIIKEVKRDLDEGR